MTKKQLTLLAAAFVAVAGLSFGLLFLIGNSPEREEEPPPPPERPEKVASREPLPAPPVQEPAARPEPRQEDKDLLANGSFEELDDSGSPSGWRKDRHPGAVSAVGDRGGKCLKLFKRDEPHVRAWQEVECKGGAEYVLSGKAKCSDLRGTAYAEVYAFSSDPAVEPRIVGKTVRFVGNCDWEEFEVPFATAEKDEKLIVYVRVQSGRGTAWFDDLRLVEQPEKLLRLKLRLAYFSLRKRRELRVEIGDPASAADGIFRLRVGSAPAVSRRLGYEREFSIDASGFGWRRVRLVATIEKEGKGTLARVEKLLDLPPAVFPLPRKWKRLEGWLALKGALPVACVSAEESCGDARDCLLRELESLGLSVVLAEAVGEPALVVGEFSGRPSKKERSGLGEGEEAYRLVVKGPRALLVANSPAGLFRGATTFVQLIERTEDGLRVPCCEITDSPDLRLRMVYCPGTSLDERLRKRAGALSMMKANAVLIESGAYFALGRPEVLRRVKEVFEYYRSLRLEPVPLIQAFGYGGAVNRADPRCAEGRWVRGERLVLRGAEPVPVAGRHVLRTEATDIVITSPDGEATYAEGRDYKVIDGELAYPYDQDARPTAIARLEGGRIADGEEVLVNYDHVWVNPRFAQKRNNIPYCPGEPRTYQVMRRAIEGCVRKLGARYIHVGHDEIRQMKTDSRCIRSGKSNAQLLAEDIKRLRSFAKGATVMMWDDMLNPHHNGLAEFPDDPTWPAAGLVPKDVVQVIWGGGSAKRRRLFAEFFLSRGLPILPSAYRGEECRGWMLFAAEKGAAGGLVTTWSSWEGVPEALEFMWTAERPASREDLPFEPSELLGAFGEEVFR